MSSEHRPGEVEVFIDGAYYDKAKSEWGLRGVDLGRFRDWCLAQCAPGLTHRLTRYYDCLPFVDLRLRPDDPVRVWQEEEARARSRFFSTISTANPRFAIREGRLAPRAETSVGQLRYEWEANNAGRMVWKPYTQSGERVYLVQKRVDLMIGLDIVQTLWKTPSVTEIILIAGDSDFIPAVEFAQAEGRQVRLVHAVGMWGNVVAHPDLVAGCDSCHTFDEQVLGSMPWQGWKHKTERKK